MSDRLDNVYVNRAMLFSATFADQPLLSNEPYVLMPGFSLGDLVWRDTNRNGVFDSGDAPLAGVPIEVLDENGLVVATASTASDGRWLVEALPAGTYRARIPAAAFAPGQPLDSYFVSTVASGLLPPPTSRSTKQHAAAGHNNTETPSPATSGLTSTAVTLGYSRTAGGVINGANGPLGDNVARLGNPLIPDEFSSLTVDLALAPLATPTIETTINADGFSDDVTVTGTEGLDGTLTWTLFGPVDPGASGTCDDVDWDGAPTFATGTVPISDDGTIVTTPATTPTEDGCYSYADTLESELYADDAISEVGQPTETFALPANPIVATVINADGYSDDVTITGTLGFDGVLTWTLFGPVAAGASGTCDDADWTDAVAHDTGTVAIGADGSYSTTPDPVPTRGGCYSYADTLSGPNYSADAISAVGQPGETFSVQVDPPSIETTINADGYSDDVTITGTQALQGTLTWTLFGPVSAGPAAPATTPRGTTPSNTTPARCRSTATART